MTINSEEYKKFYKKIKEEIELACNCIDLNPSVKISEKLEEKITLLNNKINELTEWEDTAKDTFVSNFKICINELAKIKESIDTNWNLGENYYREINDKLAELKSSFIFLDRLLEDFPIREDDEPELFYQNRVDLWEKDCEKCSIDCNNICVEISEKIKRLKEINDISLNITKISIVEKKDINPPEIKDHSINYTKSLNYGSYKTTPTSGFSDRGLKFEVTTGNQTYQLTNKDLNELYAIVASEAAHNPDDALGVISVILNRTESKDNFLGGTNPTPLSIAKASNQFEGYFAGHYKKYLNSDGIYVGDIVIKQAVDDALNGMRNTNARFFLANWCTNYSNNLITPDGNRYNYNWK